jgi:nucleotide-binding universal stress UspA family protein
MAIIVGVDGSAESIEALRWAIEEARLRKTAVRAVRVWHHPTTLGGYDSFLLGADVDPLLVEPGELRKLAKVRLAEAVAQATGDPDSVEQHVVEGHPVESLVQLATEDDLLVVGSRGRGGFSGLLLGSVSQECAHHARCPTVIVRRRPVNARA